MKRVLAILFVSALVCAGLYGGGSFGDDTTSSSSSSSSAASSGGGQDPWPLSGTLDAHDPSIIKEGDYWYVFGTGEGIQVKRSSGGYYWSNIGRVFDTVPSWADTAVPNHDGKIHAPDIKFCDGTYYLYYNITSSDGSISAIGLATTIGSLAAPDWQDQGLVIRSTSSDNYNCTHPNLVLTCNSEATSSTTSSGSSTSSSGSGSTNSSGSVGDAWLAFGSSLNGIKLIHLNPATMKPGAGAIPRTLATRSDLPVESPYIIHEQWGWFLFATVGQCCRGIDSTSKIIYGRAGKITGPYYDKDDVDMRIGGGTIIDDGDDRWRGPGGQSFFGSFNESQCMAHHAYDAENNGAATLRIRNIIWMGTEGEPTWPYYSNPDIIDDDDSDNSSGGCNGNSSSGGCN